MTAGPAKVRTLGTFLAELLVREEFLSFPVASDGGEHYKVRKYLNFALIISLPERISPFAVAKDILRIESSNGAAMQTPAELWFFPLFGQHKKKV